MRPPTVSNAKPGEESFELSDKGGLYLLVTPFAGEKHGDYLNSLPS